jgi:hypothetical protein
MPNPTPQPQSTVLLSGVQLQALKSVLQGRAEIEALTNKIVGELTAAYGHDPKTTQIDIRDLGTGLLHFEPITEPDPFPVDDDNSGDACCGCVPEDPELKQDDKIIDMVAKDGVYSETPTVPGPEST